MRSCRKAVVGCELAIGAGIFFFSYKSYSRLTDDFMTSGYGEVVVRRTAGRESGTCKTACRGVVENFTMEPYMVAPQCRTVENSASFSKRMIIYSSRSRQLTVAKMIVLKRIEGMWSARVLTDLTKSSYTGRMPQSSPQDLIEILRELFLSSF